MHLQKSFLFSIFPAICVTLDDFSVAVAKEDGTRNIFCFKKKGYGH